MLKIPRSYFPKFSYALSSYALLGLLPQLTHLYNSVMQVTNVVVKNVVVIGSEIIEDNRVLACQPQVEKMMLMNRPPDYERVERL